MQSEIMTGYKNSLYQKNQPFKRLVGCELNVLFQHKNRLYGGQGLGWRFSSARL